MSKEHFSVFLDRLKTIVGPQRYDEVVASFARLDVLSVRINTLKITRLDILPLLRERKISFREVSWSAEALILDGILREALGEMDFIKDGVLYRQSLSSMLPVVILDPKPGESVLDMCAAPGSKTTQMAARMNNEGEIAAVEAIRGRYYKLRSVAALLGVRNVVFELMDARRFKPRQFFDKILVDVPCSCECRFKTGQPKTYAYWSPRKIKEMARKQKGLILQASRLLKPGGVLVYATCTFAPEENEEVIDWVLRKTAGRLQVEPIAFPKIPTYPAVSQWQGKTYDAQTQNCLRVLPFEDMEGFFIARLSKLF